MVYSPRLLTPVVALLTLLAACRSQEGLGCSQYSAASSPDTTLGAQVAGSPWLLSSAEPYQWPGLDTVNHVLTVGGLLGTRQGGASLGFNIYGFSGPGVYPMNNSSTPGTSSGQFYCEPNGDPYVATGSNGDTVSVVAFDPQTGLVSGTFSFHARVPTEHGASITVTNGTFHVVASKY